MSNDHDRGKQSSAWVQPNSCLFTNTEHPQVPVSALPKPAFGFAVTAPRKRKLEHHGSAADSSVLADEEMARRLHEELNAGMTRRRGSNAAAMKCLELAVEHRTSKHEIKNSREAAGKHSSGSMKQDQAAAKAQPAASAVEQQDTPANLCTSQVKESAKSSLQSSRKRSLLSRELAMLVTDMVEAQLRPAKSNRHQVSPLPNRPRAAGQRDSSSSDDEEEDHAENHAADNIQQAGPGATKPETSSCHSEQDRVVEEHMRSMRVKAEVPKVRKLTGSLKTVAGALAGTAGATAHLHGTQCLLISGSIGISRSCVTVLDVWETVERRMSRFNHKRLCSFLL